MSRIFNKASGISLTAALLITVVGASGSRAAAENTLAAPFPGVLATTIPAGVPLNQNIQPTRPADAAVQPAPAPSRPESDADVPPAPVASSLEQLVAVRADAGGVTENIKCLAGAIYFEARSESLEGQLAVGRVIVARTRSGRFPASYCGVVHQHSQFSFMHGQTMPSVNSQSPLWQKAVAMARIADSGSWQSSAEGALFFHAARVATNWRMTRIAQIDHHIFYR